MHPLSVDAQASSALAHLFTYITLECLGVLHLSIPRHNPLLFLHQITSAPLSQPKVFCEFLNHVSTFVSVLPHCSNFRTPLSCLSRDFALVNLGFHLPGVFFSPSNPLNHRKTAMFAWLVSSILNMCPILPSTRFSIFHLIVFISISFLRSCMFFLLPVSDVGAGMYYCPTPTCSTYSPNSAVSLSFMYHVRVAQSKRSLLDSRDPLSSSLTLANRPPALLISLTLANRPPALLIIFFLSSLVPSSIPTCGYFDFCCRPVQTPAFLPFLGVSSPQNVTFPPSFSSPLFPVPPCC